MRVGSFIVKRSTICVLRNEWSPAEPRIPIIRWDGYLWIGVMRRNVSSCRDFGTIRRSGPALGRWRLKRILSGKDFTTHPQTERQQSHLWWCMKWVKLLLENLGFWEELWRPWKNDWNAISTLRTDTMQLQCWERGEEKNIPPVCTYPGLIWLIQ